MASPNVRAQYDREYYAKNKTKVLHVQRVYREKNKDHYKLWYQQNKTRVLARVKLYNQRRKYERATHERMLRWRSKLADGSPLHRMHLSFILN
ncbi:hypothetical protein Ae201684P_015779 [Aphanomyces euteiches]|nr:hypothetical protein Ae201684P_015779 [Aphanomyces euteiches]